MKTDLKSRYSITKNFGMTPNQLWATGPNGELYYLRGRHDGWQLYKNNTDELLNEGTLYGAGWMELEEWEAFFWDVIENCVENGNEYPQAIANNQRLLERKVKELHDEMMKQSPRHSIEVDEVIKMIRRIFPDYGWW